MAPAFSWTHVRSLGQLMADECQQFRKTLDGLAKRQEVFNMEDISAKLIFDIIGRIVFNAPLRAQTTGSSYLTDLREMIRLAETQLSMNPFIKFKGWLKAQWVLRRLHPSLDVKIKERLTLLRREQIIPSRKDPESILDLMLREHVQTQGEMEKPTDELAPEYMDLLRVK
jgi:cytochrome P450